MEQVSGQVMQTYASTLGGESKLSIGLPQLVLDPDRVEVLRRTPDICLGTLVYRDHFRLRLQCIQII
jgi:hypothetical protein